MYDIYGGMDDILSPVRESVPPLKAKKNGSAWRGLAICIKSAAVAGQLCIEVAYLGTIMALWGA